MQQLKNEVLTVTRLVWIVKNNQVWSERTKYINDKDAHHWGDVVCTRSVIKLIILISLSKTEDEARYLCSRCRGRCRGRRRRPEAANERQTARERPALPPAAAADRDDNVPLL
ncbi:hypothetical protein EVAR_43358_1 [Eumeta japonica]|uniref:Uncharacterized protein n=1 Tax=Eumeta variegata TaxID=151549 RepID=A0A4C1WR97_EUMVA|nr:hypothetical protein EVAR_43358_1 [Eumeta japonica]